MAPAPGHSRSLSNIDFGGCLVVIQGLSIGIYRNEFNPFDVGFNHSVERISSTASHAQNFNAGNGRNVRSHFKIPAFRTCAGEQVFKTVVFVRGTGHKKGGSLGVAEKIKRVNLN